jgi:hypothetical protein
VENGPETGALENFDEFVIVGYLKELDKKKEAVELKVKSYSLMNLMGSVVYPMCEEENC